MADDSSWGGVPAQHRPPEEKVTRETIRVGAFFCAAAAAGFAALYAARGPAEFVAPNLVAGVLLAAIGAVRASRPAVSLYAATILGLLLFGYQLLLLGRVDNGIAVWFLVPCIAAMVVGMRARPATRRLQP